jgi:hypothetical protein
VSAAVVQVAVPALTACVVQPEMALPPFVKPTAPVAVPTETVAVNVTLEPKLDGLGEAVSVVLVAALLTVCVSVGLVEPV